MSLESTSTTSSTPPVPQKKRLKFDAYMADKNDLDSSSDPHGDHEMVLDASAFAPPFFDTAHFIKILSSPAPISVTSDSPALALSNHSALKPKPQLIIPSRPAPSFNGAEMLDDERIVMDDPFGDVDPITPTGSESSSQLPYLSLLRKQSFSSGWGTDEGDTFNFLRESMQDHDTEIVEFPSPSTFSIDETSSSFRTYTMAESQPSLPCSWGSVEELARFARRIDPNQPIDTFTEEEILNMKRASEFLHALFFDDEASSLYTLLIKRYQAEGGQNGSIFATTIYYAHAALSKVHCETVQNLLQTEQRRNASPLTSFVAHMTLAHTYARCENDEKAAEHLYAALDCGDGEALLAQLPAGDRSFDLIAYHYAARCMSLPLGQVTLRDVEILFQCEPDQPAGDLQDLILARIPGPFEIADGSMQNPCIRSCLFWCKKELNSIDSVPGSWREMDPTSSYISCAEIVAMFTCLWNRTQNPSSDDDPYLTLWITETQHRMGISHTYLLILICRMTFFPESWKRARSNIQLVKNMKQRFSKLLKLSDTELAIAFLEKFARTNCLSGWSSDRQAFQEVSRDHALGVLRKTLMVIPPSQNFTEDSDDDSAVTPRQSFPNLYRTLAPSPDSASLHRMRNKYQRSISTISLDSVQSAAKNAAYTTHPSISELTLALSNSHLSDTRWDSTSVDSRTSAFSRTVQDIFEELEPLLG